VVDFRDAGKIDPFVGFVKVAAEWAELDGGAKLCEKP
jgi:hypothetical protein